ncbi:winged helix-turn-helix domain-containing protein [Streptomyces hydrogenans]|uniref:winged helix-turn-helix domain-containing protein n=1 Tax=Streptomyces hydrogenans TaxID=1873719 RepID=UPI0035DFC4BA
MGRAPPLHGRADRSWTPARTKTSIGRLFHASPTIKGARQSLARHRWNRQRPARWVVERDDDAVGVRKRKTWPRPRRSVRTGHPSRGRPAPAHPFTHSPAAQRPGRRKVRTAEAGTPGGTRTGTRTNSGFGDRGRSGSGEELLATAARQHPRLSERLPHMPYSQQFLRRPPTTCTDFTSCDSSRPWRFRGPRNPVSRPARASRTAARNLRRTIPRSRTRRRTHPASG